MARRAVLARRSDGIAWWLLGVAGWRGSSGPRGRAAALPAIIDGDRRPTQDRVRLLVSRRAKQPFASVAGRSIVRRNTAVTSAEMAVGCAGGIVLPENLYDDEQAMRSALAHEWTHIERHDFRAWFVAGLARVLFFYQPLMWWLRRQLRLCQDFVADAQASRQAPQPEDYAEFLTVRAAAGSLHPAMAGLGMVFANRNSTGGLSCSYENPTAGKPPPRLWTVSVTCVALLLVAAVSALTLSPQAAAQGKSAGAKSGPVDQMPPSATKSFEGIQPLDLLTIRVLGTLIDQPIDGLYLVEPSGQVTLGPAYGRVELKGLTLETAEAAIQKQLAKTLASTDVQVTAAGHATHWHSGQVPIAPYHISPNDLLQIRVWARFLAY